MRRSEAFFTKITHIVVATMYSLLTTSFSFADAPVSSAAEKQELIAVIPTDTAPTSYRDKATGKAEGFAVEAMDIIAARLGVKISYLFVSNWDEVINAVVQGNADVAPDMAITPERQKLLDFTSPLEVIPIRYFVRSGSGWSEARLAQSVIGAMKGSAAGEILKKRDVRLIYYNTYIDGIYDLLAGRIDAFAGPEPTIRKLLLDAGIEERVEAEEKQLTEIKRCLAVHKGNRDLLARLEPAVQEFITSPAYRELNDKWYGKPPSWWHNETFHKAAIVVLIIIIILLSAWRYRAVTRLNRELSTAVEERKRSEDKIRIMNEDLERRVQERTSELQSALHHHESFTYSISHDLRAPLRAISGYSTLLSENFSALLPAEGKAHLEKMAANARKMGHLIDALLAFSRFNRQQLVPESVDLSLLVKEMVSSFAAEKAKRSITIDIGQLPPCTADPTLIREAIYNLIANAVKFTGRQKAPMIVIGAEQRAGTTVYFVSDNGVGFDMAYYDKLFGVCQRLHGMDDFEGTGVGLAIARNIIERHGGKIWAEGEPGKGATFYFSL